MAALDIKYTCFASTIGDDGILQSF